MSRAATLLTCLLFCGSAFGFGPPQVVDATPDHGDWNVDPGLTELRVSFDQDMGKGVSWVGGGTEFPEVVTPPNWITGRECVLGVKLVPNHLYRMSLNSTRHRNFKNAGGEALEPYMIWFRTGSDDPKKREAAAAKGLTAEQNTAALATLEENLRTRYAYRDRLGLDWTAVLAAERDNLVASPSSFTFAARLARVMASADDLHMSVRADDVVFPTFQREATRNYNWQVLSRTLQDRKRHSSAVMSGRLADGIGYIMIGTWDQSQAAEIENAFAVLESMGDTRGLIIDVRGNGGGNEMIARRFAGCFIQEPAVYATHVFADPNQPGGFTSPAQRVVEPNPDGPSYRKPVAVLMGPSNMSSCEAFLLMMNQSPQCELIGMRSYGSSGNPKPHELGNGVTIMLPSWRAMRADGTAIEGEGIDPDIEVSTTLRDFRSEDPVLERAVEWIEQQ